jgi:hypothetical protein
LRNISLFTVAQGLICLYPVSTSVCVNVGSADSKQIRGIPYRTNCYPQFPFQFGQLMWKALLFSHFLVFVLFFFPSQTFPIMLIAWKIIFFLLFHLFFAFNIFGYSLQKAFVIIFSFEVPTYWYLVHYFSTVPVLLTGSG